MNRIDTVMFSVISIALLCVLVLLVSACQMPLRTADFGQKNSPGGGVYEPTGAEVRD